MDEICQLCLKIGTKRKIKAIQVNLTEALWMCENEECLWPFGYEKPKIFSRRVGDKWAFEWQTYRKVEKTIGRIPVSAELSLYTPPVTPSGDAATRDSTKSDFDRVTNISCHEGDDGVSLSEPLPRDSYSPGCTPRGMCIHQNPSDSEESDKSIKIASSENKDDSTIVDRTPSLSSIFNISSDKLLDNERTIELASTDQANSSSSESLLDLTNSKTVDNPIDTVFDRPHERETAIERCIQGKKIVNDAAVNMDIGIVRSIPKTNMNLKKCSSWKNIKETVYPALGDIDNNLRTPKQHTTMITVEGIPPITLSYNLADLCEKSETIVPVTSIPIQTGSKIRMFPAESNDREEKSKPPVELPKRQATLSSKRRTDHGKKYEKFSFKALRKTAQETKECNETKLIEIDCKRQESLRYESRLVCNTATIGVDTSGIPIPIANHSETNNSNQTDESSSLLNAEANYSNSVENMNLSCLLDDMLLDGCQNVTKNLNDDWLESFFT